MLEAYDNYQISNYIPIVQNFLTCITSGLQCSAFSIAIFKIPVNFSVQYKIKSIPCNIEYFLKLNNTA